MPLAIFGIENDGLNLAVNLLILFLVVVYLALIAYTYFDARRRLEDPVLVASATVAALFPFVGTIVYTIVRPPEFLEDKRERELETRAAQLRVRQLEANSCPNCEYPVERTFLRCPSCRARIKDPCDSCGKPIDPRWSICPYCETPTRRAAEAAPPRRRPAAAAEGSKRAATRPKRPSTRTAESASKRKPSGSRSSTSKREAGAERPVARRAQSTRSSERGDEGPRTAPAS